MNMKKNYIVSLLIAGLTLYSCDDFLTQNPEHELVQENAVTDYNSAKNIVNGMYAVYEDSKFLGGYIYGYLHSQAGIWDAQENYYNMAYSQSNPGNTSSIWIDIYSCINAANAAIEGVSALNTNLFPSEEKKNDLIAEARCFRGFMNSQLLLLYSRWFDNSDSPYGILYREKLSDLSNLMIERSTIGASYQYILDDLEFAEKYLRNYESAKYVSKQFAQALHAKLLLIRGWDGDYEKALALVNEVMNTAPAKLKMETDITTLYENGWNSNEVLFARYLGDLGKIASNEYMYSGALYENNTFKDIPSEWIKNDERYTYTFGSAYGNQDWNSGTLKEDILTKLYHRGATLGPNDMYCAYVLRYAELYLMKSELQARTNPSDIQGALKTLNEMRAQYSTPIMTAITGITTHEQLMDAIFKEYIVTLLMENDASWFASIRFKKDSKTWLETLKPDVNISSNKYCWPIPDSEIVSHTNKIEQNPGLE